MCGRARGWIAVSVRSEALRRLGLHPDQPGSRVEGPLAPDWWGLWQQNRKSARRTDRATVALVRSLIAAGTPAARAEKPADPAEEPARETGPARPAGADTEADADADAAP
ncbi:hypothetical protein [Kitasatospora camelliae]|uniref:Uncharacterized protein n=1 Tax=Kitasatospora camelliae TaxID=3156397 RepID=A0AAU8JRN3_9ACTN